MAVGVISPLPAVRPARAPQLGRDEASGLCRLACDPLRGNAILPWLSPFHRQCRGGKETRWPGPGRWPGPPHRQL